MYNSFTVGYIILVLFTISILAYLLGAYPLYKMYKLADLKNPWMAFIPLIGACKLYNLANVSMWTIPLLMLIYLIPFVGPLVVVIYSIWLTWKICSNFGVGVLGCILSIFFSTFVYWYIALTNKEFLYQLNTKYTN